MFLPVPRTFVTVVLGERGRGGVSRTVHGPQKITNHESQISKGHFSSRVRIVTRFCESGLEEVLYGRR